MRWTYGKFEKELLAGPMTAHHAWGEVEELFEAIQEGSLEHIREEWNDSWLCWMLWVMKYLDIRWMPILPGFGLSSVEKFQARWDTWQAIFTHHDAGEFRKEFYLGGSNYRKPHKVVRVLETSGWNGQVDWAWVENLVGGFEE